MCTSVFFAALFTIDKNMETKVKWQSIDTENVGKAIYIYTTFHTYIYNGISFKI